MIETIIKIEESGTDKNIKGIEEILYGIIMGTDPKLNVMDFMSEHIENDIIPCEREVFLLKLYGLSNVQISDESHIELTTVQQYLNRILDKFRPFFGEEYSISTQNLISLALGYVASGQAYLPTPPETLKNEYFFNNIRKVSYNHLKFDVIDLMSNELDKNLSPKEKEILLLKMYGLSNDKIADELEITPLTAQTHINHIHKKSKSFFEENGNISGSALTSLALAYVVSGQASLPHPTESLMKNNPFLEKVWNPKMEYLKV